MDAADIDDLLSRLKEIEELLQFPAVEGHLKRTETLALSIARKAPTGAASNLAMRVVSEVSALRPGAMPVKSNDARLHGVLRELRIALEEAKRGKE
jgi:hypothetical protein